MYSLGMPPNWWWMHAESSELRFPFTGPFGARRWLGHQIQLRHKHCLRRFSVGVWFFLGNQIDFQTCFLLYQTMCTFTTPTGFQSTPVEAMFRTWCRSLHGMSQQEPGVRWVGRCTWKTQGPINPDRWNPQTVGKKKLSQKEGDFWKYNFAIFQIWCDLTWFDVICRCLCGMENAAHYHHNRWFAVLHK